MKKLSYKVLILVVCLVNFLSGCSTDPETYSIDGDSGWKINEKGTISAFGVERSLTCDKPTACPQGCLDHGSYYYMKFDDGTYKALGRIRNPKDIKVGQVGTLYKYGGWVDKIAWFQWIEDESTIEFIEAEPIIEKSIPIVEIEAELAKVEKSIVKYQWRRVSDVKDIETHEIVLIKLNDGVITTGFMTYDRKWKLCTNKDQYNNGKTLNNVIEWKKIDLE